ncbi:MAG: tyrosine-type recombinase/integrase [Lachnospiraceae bacterium]
MPREKTYQEQLEIKHTLRLREILNTLPAFSRDFFRGIEPTTTTRTRISYAFDLRVFFQFIMDVNPQYTLYSMPDIPIAVLDQLKAVDIEEYLEYLKVYETDGKIHTNTERGLKRKLSSLRSFYAYYYKREMIQTNPSLLVDMPKIHQKSIVRLDTDEMALLLDHIENCGNSLTGQKKKYYEKTRQRDLAMITLLLGTGIRVSECVGLDLADVDFKNNGILVTRKGGNQMIVYFGTEVEQALLQYINGSRSAIQAIAGHEHALFYSTQRRRMGIQAVENLVKKYASEVTSTKRITPHKLRSTYGTALYHETGDIYLVADVLGHKDVNTTKKHYAALDDDRRRKAANAVTLRELNQ